MKTLHQGRKQRGAVLVVGLIFLAMLSLLGVAAHSAASQEERMSGNTRDRVRSFQAAESSLRDCESTLLVDEAALPAFDGTGGAYTARAHDATYQIPDDPTFDWKSATTTRVVPSGAQVSGVARQPRCIVERVSDIWIDDGLSMPKAKKRLSVFRITAVGFGSNDTSTTRVQTTYVRQ